MGRRADLARVASWAFERHSRVKRTSVGRQCRRRVRLGRCGAGGIHRRLCTRRTGAGSEKRNDEQIDVFHAVVLSVMRPRFASAVSSEASAALPPREPAAVGFVTGVAPNKPTVVAVNTCAELAK